MARDKVWILGNAKHSKVLVALKNHLQSIGFTILENLDDVERVDVLLNCHETSDNVRQNPKFHYSTIITIMPEQLVSYPGVRNKRSDVYVSKISKDRYVIRNSELFEIHLTSPLNLAVIGLTAQIEDKLNRKYISVVPDESPKDLTKCLTDSRKSNLLLNANECTSISVHTRNRPHNGLSTLSVYRNVKFSNSYPMLVSYFDNVNGIIRYSKNDSVKERLRVPLDLIAHQSIHQALSLIGEAVVVFNQFELEDKTYCYSNNLTIIDPLPINSVEYYQNLGLTVAQQFDLENELDILIPNRGVFQLIPLSYSDEKISECIHGKRKRKTWDEIINTEV